MQSGEYRTVPINAAGKMYLFAADGYMTGHIIGTSNTNIQKLIERDEYVNGTHTNRKDINRWVESVSNFGRGSKDSISLLETGKRATNDDQVFIRTSESNRAGHNE
jgi:hypothetical protein